jgi:hypothetical protein
MQGQNSVSSATHASSGLSFIQKARLEQIRATLHGILITGFDIETYRWPKENELGYVAWAERINTTQECFKAARETGNVAEAIQVLSTLVAYLEDYAKQPFAASGFADMPDGSKNLWMKAVRHPDQDKFFQERAIDVARKAIAGLGPLAAANPQTPTTAPNVPEPSATGNTVAEVKPTQAALAMFYYYCHQAKCLPYFHKHPEGTVAAYKEAVAPYGLSFKAFQTKYLHLTRSGSGSNSGQRQRTANENRPYLLEAIKMLAVHPAAEAEALRELNVAKAIEDGKPLT